MDDIFTTNAYKVLKVMHSNTLTIADKTYCPLSQAEIANDLGLSRVAVNKIYKELIKKGYIEMIVHGKWKLTAQANDFIQSSEKL